MSKSYKNILIDLDGTISDSSIGIIKAFKFAFEKMKAKCPTDKELVSFIGPPLGSTFSKYFSEKDVIEARKYYREYYLSKGMYENILYPEIENVLSKLNKNHRLFVATCKATYNASNIIENFNLSEYFEGVYGVDPEINVIDKTDVIKYIMDKYNLKSDETLFIGDTLHDTIGAYENNIDMVFANYGFGEKEEVADYNICFYADFPSEILNYIR